MFKSSSSESFESESDFIMKIIIIKSMQNIRLLVFATNQQQTTLSHLDLKLHQSFIHLLKAFNYILNEECFRVDSSL